ncbi:LytTR family DNA-binding domain-containing protein [Maricaulis sp. MIT060901]|uniref:LytTR family DNA-binding domain-containing protein n=1 Tax=Maricaulis sp. MIT060901 TaxID=3096993 RepID=UPI00399BB016
MRLSGPFAATVYLNGRRVGSEGDAAIDGLEGEALIDSSHDLSSARAGTNELMILVSSSKAGLHGHRLLQDLALTPELRPDARQAGYYWAGISLIGLLILIVLGFAHELMRNGVRWHTGWMLVAAVSLALALSAEISRAIINYPYVFHLPRMFVLSLGTLSAVLTWWIAQRREAGWRVPAAMLGSAGMLVLVGMVLGINPDTVTLIGLALIALLIAGEMIVRAGLRSALIDPVMAVLLATAIIAIWSPWAFLDNTVFLVLGLVLMVELVGVFQPGTATETAPVAVTTCLQTESGEKAFILAEVVAIHAAGNYAEFEMEDGQRQLTRGAFNKLMEQLAPSFMRVHRSHIVNMDYATRLQVRPSSRYSLFLGQRREIPVSRSLAGAVRERLKDAED